MNRVLNTTLTLGLLAFPNLSESSIKGPFFNLDEQPSYTDPYRGIFRRGSDLESLILQEIDGAQHTIDVAIQELRLPHLARALVRKQRYHGVQVRVILENDYNYSIAELTDADLDDLEGYGRSRVEEYLRFVDMNGDGHLSAYEISQRDAISILRNNNIPMIDDTADGSKGSSLMHHKFVVVDGTRLVVTSANFTMSDIHGDYSSTVSRGNANALVIIDDLQTVSSFQREFNVMWGSEGAKQNAQNKRPRFGLQKPYRGAQHTRLSSNSAITVQFSPTSRTLGFAASGNGLIDRTLRKAQKSVDMALFVFSEKTFSNTLQELRQFFPLEIRALVERGFAFQWYSGLLNMLGLEMLSPGCKTDEGNNPWTNPIRSVGVPQMPRGDLLHHKFGVVDNRYVIFGSQNWSAAANYGNDENVLVIEDTRVAQRFTDEFNRLYRNSTLGNAPASVHRRIQERIKNCSSN